MCENGPILYVFSCLLLLLLTRELVSVLYTLTGLHKHLLCSIMLTMEHTTVNYNVQLLDLETMTGLLEMLDTA